MVTCPTEHLSCFAALVMLMAALGKPNSERIVHLGRNNLLFKGTRSIKNIAAYVLLYIYWRVDVGNRCTLALNVFQTFTNSLAWKHDSGNLPTPTRQGFNVQKDIFGSVGVPITYKRKFIVPGAWKTIRQSDLFWMLQPFLDTSLLGQEGLQDPF